MRNEFADRQIAGAAQDLAARRGIELIERFLPSSEYDELVAACDLVLLPYEREQYRSRLSAVFVDAACAGVPVVVPAGTWMSDQIDACLGAGATFDALAPAAIAEAVRTCLASLPALAQTARERASRSLARHDARIVWDTIIASRRAAA
jgi:glycosyltransferase involved in cell wall biosynthesis